MQELLGKTQETLVETLAVSTNTKLRSQRTGDRMHKANRFVLWYACWHISEKRPRRGLWRELYLQRRWAPLPGALFGTGRKEEKTRLSLPPRLVGANEGGTDRPVYALPLSGSCRASTPKCTLHRSRCSAVSLSLSLCPSVSLYSSYLVLRNFVEREAGTLFATSATTPSSRRYVVARSPSRERGLSNRRSGEARCRQLSAREKVEVKARRQEEVKEEGQEMKEKEIPKYPFPCLKTFDFGLTTTELKVVKERRNSSTAAENNAFQTKTESRHAGRSEMVHADGRELVNERTRAIH
ncbi:hypothetical protein ALC53_02618 [Atta colombica]|uniref:Uncharacterized protein n=1 Tax=Atta colombica TaxID=520822 RepID=A0A195BQI4_9HYME|nr:hypothetical protein ALC53_02618 [Atta colombica]